MRNPLFHKNLVLVESKVRHSVYQYRNPILTSRGKLKHLMVWIGLLAYLTLGLCNTPGMVLCFGKDGHIAIESGQGCADQMSVHNDGQDVAQAHSDQESVNCQCCVDVPICMHSAEPHNTAIQMVYEPVQIPLATQASPVDIGYLAIVTQELLPHPPPLKPPIHQLLSTVVLLI